MAYTPSLLGLGTSALTAYRSALTATSNNISNVGVDGYSRQSVDLAQQDSLRSSIGFIGNGVETVDISRSYDQFLTRNLNTAIASGNHHDTYHKYASAVDETVADPEMGMTPALTSFFNSMQDLSNNPSSIPARQVMYGEGEALVSRFNLIHREMETVRDQTREEAAAIVESINGIARSIAEINSRVAEAKASSAGHPNELLDRRDILMKELSEYIGINTMEQEGMVSVFVGKGQALINGGSYNQLSLEGSQYSGTEDLSLYMVNGKHKSDVTAAIKGGDLGGIVDFTKEVLNPAENSLGRIALTLSATLNAHHRNGFGMGGSEDTGKDFFKLGTMSTDANGFDILKLTDAVVTNTSDAELTVSIPMSNSEIEVGPVSTSAISGLTLNGTSIGDVASQDTAADSATALVDAINAKSDDSGVKAELGTDNKIKLISDSDIVVGQADGGDIAATGLEEGTYKMLRSSIKELTADDYVLSYDGSNYVITNQTTQAQRVLSDAEGNQLTDMGANGTGLVHDGLTFRLNNYKGMMEKGDRIEIQATRGAAQNIGMALQASELSSIAASDAVDESGNNNNILSMIGLQTEKLLSANANGDATTGLQDGYGQLVADIGIQAHYADVNRVAQESIRNNAQAARDNNAAVNLDEEAANLMKFQQMYQASTKVISMADKLFQSVLNAV